MTNSKKLLVLSVVFLTMALPVLAQETELEQVQDEITAQDLEVEEQTLLPDSPFYFFKNAWRRIRETFTFNTIKKIELKEKFAGEHLIELRELAKKGASPELLEKATGYYSRENEQIRARIENMEQGDASEPQLNQFLNKFSHQRILHLQILEKLEEQVPEQVREKISEQREEHLEHFTNVMLKLEDKENIPERLEAAIDKVRGNDFQEFKNIETLQEISEKMPEGVKEQLEDISSIRIQHFQEKLEQLSEQAQEQLQNYIEELPGNKERQLELLRNVNQGIENLQLRQRLESTHQRMLQENARK